MRNALDARIVRLLWENLDAIKSSVRARQLEAREYYETRYAPAMFAA